MLARLAAASRLVFYSILDVFRRRHRAVFVAEVPGILHRRRVYVVGADDVYWSAALSCPCGCGDVIQLALVGIRPRWELRLGFGGAVSLNPSVWRTVGCGSHFWVSEGDVRWCTAHQSDSA